MAPDHTFVVIPAEKGWPLKSGIDVVSLDELKNCLFKRTRGLEKISGIRNPRGEGAVQ
jgi:hypothetical protein